MIPRFIILKVKNIVYEPGHYIGYMDRMKPSKMFKSKFFNDYFIVKNHNNVVNINILNF